MVENSGARAGDQIADQKSAVTAVSDEADQGTEPETVDAVAEPEDELGAVEPVIEGFHSESIASHEEASFSRVPDGEGEMTVEVIQTALAPVIVGM